ncbi:DUF5131 family protein [Streptomyces sp. NPDC007896]|uniref:DUF5131 family protein n=1 Tax=Streptomyces sp. NPDC007896 TaxID=3364784 RepID=UPI0036E89A30
MQRQIFPDADPASTSRSRSFGASAIEWTEATWNPTTGCDRVSKGCGGRRAAGRG